MKEIDVTTWKRRAPYENFASYSNPVFSMTVRLDVTKIVEYSKRTETSFFINFLFVVTKCLNQIEDFRIRIKDGKVVVYDVITPSYIVRNDNGVIVTKQTEYSSEYKKFYELVSKDIQEARNLLNQQKFNDANKNDLFYMSALSWIDFTSISNPYQVPDAAQTSIPRIAWGKYVNENGKLKMAFDISAHHALMDGYEMSQGFNSIQKAIDDIENFLK